MKKTKKNRFLCILLSLALLLGLMPGMSLTAYAMTETYTKLMNDKTIVKFNNCNWYIIADDSTATGGTVTLLAADTSFGKSAFGSDEYSTSDVKSMLDGLTAEGGSFAGVKDAIADTDLTDVGVTGAKLYLLNNNDVYDDYSPKDFMNFFFNGAQNGGWWLRTPDGPWIVRIVTQSDNYNFAFAFAQVTNDYGVRPALRLDLSKVKFDSANKVFSLASSTVAVTNVTLSPNTAQTIEIDGTVTFTATVEPGDATDKTVKWSVNNTNVKLYSDSDCKTEVGADVTSTLTVYAKGENAGDATVTVTSNADNTKSASCNVTVNAANVTENKIDENSTDGKGTLTATYDVDAKFTVTIPAGADMSGDGVDVQTITAENVVLEKDQTIKVTLSGASNTESGSPDFSAKNGDSVVNYTIKAGTKDIALGDEIVTFTANGTQALTFTKDADSTPTAAGAHTETLTFTVAVDGEGTA